MTKPTQQQPDDDRLDIFVDAIAAINELERRLDHGIVTLSLLRRRLQDAGQAEPGPTGTPQKQSLAPRMRLKGPHARCAARAARLGREPSPRRPGNRPRLFAG